MRVIICLLVQLMLPQFLQAETLLPFKSRLYTPYLVVDSESKGHKGAVQLLWQKVKPGLGYEVQIDNGKSIYSAVTEKHFFHTMLFFNKDYRWRVRSLSSKVESEYSEWATVRVLSNDKEPDERNILAEERAPEELQELAFDQGG